MFWDRQARAFNCRSYHLKGYYQRMKQCLKPTSWTKPVAQPTYEASLDHQTLVVLQCINFMNCHGVTEELSHPSTTPLQKKWSHKTGCKLPLVSYTTLNIGITKVHRGDRDPGSVTPRGHHREHWVRGHVARYPGGLLFGRVKLAKPGIWRKAHKRGKAQGEVRHTEYVPAADPAINK